MYIEEVILDGFKSYATRTTVGKFDSKFNAITGLNGSGKSNILDGICFVLGIAMDKVRAANLQDLIYKKGQAGINKASVTIIFNNFEKNTSPPKYSDCDTISVTRQIVIGGKNKYIVNGKNESLQQVTEMFQSVQLNINNPNFLIMQGKITHVLNMKANQILGMVEEAAGTRLYEDRKEKAIKAMEKKDLKLAQSAALLETEITPKLDDLREKKRSLLEYQKVSLEMEHLEKVLTAHQFVSLMSAIGKQDEKQENSKQRIAHLAKMRKMLKDEIKEIQDRAEEVTRERSTNGGTYFELEEKVKELSKEIAKMKTQMNLKSTLVSDEQSGIAQLNLNLEELSQSLDLANKNSDELVRKCASAVEEYEGKTAALKETESLVQTLTTGLGSSEGQENGYMDQLTAAKQEESQTTAEIQQLKIKLSHLGKQIKADEAKAKKSRKENLSLVHELESKKNVLSMLKEQLDSISIDTNLESSLLKKRNELEDQSRKLQKEISNLESAVRSVDFQYSDPEPNFDRSKVKGFVATLFSIPKEHHNKANALEICAGGKLFQVLVENNEVGTKLLKKGKLAKRVTIIPLNQLNAFQVQAERIATAKMLAPGAVDLALTLIGSDADVAKAMAYVFGSTLICKDSDTAKLVTFDKRINLRSVTYDGDTFDPSGLLSGGAKSQQSGSLLKIQSLLELKEKRLQVEAKLAEVVEELNDIQSSKKLHESSKQEYDLKSHELKLHENRLNNNPHFKLVQNFESLVEEHKGCKESLEKAKLKEEASRAKIVEIEKEMSELSNNRESKVESLKKKVAASKKALAKLEPSVSKMQEEILLAKEQILQIDQEIIKTKNAIAAYESNILNAKSEEKSLAEELKTVEDNYRFESERLGEERKSLAQFDKELGHLEKEMALKAQSIEDGKLESQQLEIELQGFTSALDQSKKQLKILEKDNPWIKDQKQLFGVQGGMYDFSKLDINDAMKRLKLLKNQCDNLGKNIDRTVLELYDRVEKRETSLKEKLSTVQKDKTSIQSTLEYLDRKKLDQLKKTWKKVNADFGAIFGDLLPGNTCKLEPPQDLEISDGLEIRVCLGGVWKSSLTELSGGQRSLIALSLILALLQFNPAPMYILDEVDAALDLSHTQNIGKLLKTRFRTSQFILVSLKDGMFNNANVLFRTKFVDGVSQVDRREQNRDGQIQGVKRVKKHSLAPSRLSQVVSL